MEGLRESLGHLLRNVRCERGLTILEVDELTAKQGCRVPRSRLSLLERGEAPIRFEDLAGLSRAYGFTLIDLTIEVVAARPPGHFPAEWTAERLFDEGKCLFDKGKLHEAGWAFDAAAVRAEPTDRDMVGLAWISAAHCYDRLGAARLAMRRGEQALDTLRGESEESKRAIGKMAILLAGAGAPVRARVFLDATLAALGEGPAPRLKAYLLDSSASTMHLLGNLDAAVEHSLRAARLYRKLGEFDFSGLKLAAAATYLAKQGKLKRAVRYARDAEGTISDLARIDTRVFVLVALGKVLNACGLRDEARERLEDAFRLAIAHGLTVRAREAAEQLEKMATECGDAAQRRRWRSRLRRFSRSDLGLLVSAMGWDTRSDQIRRSR